MFKEALRTSGAARKALCSEMQPPLLLESGFWGPWAAHFALSPTISSKSKPAPGGLGGQELGLSPLVVVPGWGCQGQGAAGIESGLRQGWGHRKGTGREQASPCWCLLHPRGAAEGQTKGSETTMHKDVLETEATSPREASRTTTMRPQCPEPSKSCGLSTARFQGLWSPQAAEQGSVHPPYTVLALRGAGKPDWETDGRQPFWPWHVGALGGTEATQTCPAGILLAGEGSLGTGSSGGLSLESRVLGFCHSCWQQP